MPQYDFFSPNTRCTIRTVRITDCTNHSSVLLWIDNVNDSHVFNLRSIYGHKYNSPFVWWLFEYRFPKKLIRFLLIASGYVFIWLSNSDRYIVCIYIGDTGWVLSYRAMLIHSCYRNLHSYTRIPPRLYRPVV